MQAVPDFDFVLFGASLEMKLELPALVTPISNNNIIFRKGDIAGVIWIKRFGLGIARPESLRLLSSLWWRTIALCIAVSDRWSSWMSFSLSITLKGWRRSLISLSLSISMSDW
jgi:hypothetical protein